MSARQRDGRAPAAAPADAPPHELDQSAVTVRYVQFLDPEGRLHATAPEFAHDPAELLRMYRNMTLTRVFDTKAVNLQRTGKLGTYAASLGHEASHTGIAAAMRKDDCLAPSYREYGSLLWRGVTMSDILLYWGGDERGSDFTASRHDFPFAIPISTQCLHAAGAAMAFQLRGEERCAVSVNGDGGTSEGAFYEALNIAGAKTLPVVFVVVNNKWAISMPQEEQTASRTLAQKGIAAGLPGLQVDGNDVIAVRHCVANALERARRGGGATVIEAVTYRLSDHTTADDATRYRPAEEVERAWRVEPLIRLRRHLTDIGAWDETREAQLQAECIAAVDAAVETYVNTPPAPTTDMFDHLFETLPEALSRQREAAALRARRSR